MAEKDLISKPVLADGSGHVHRRDVLKGMINTLGFCNNAGDVASDPNWRERHLTAPTQWTHALTIGPRDKSGSGFVAGSALPLAVSNGPAVLSSGRLAIV